MLLCLSVYTLCALLPTLLPQPLLYLALRCLTGVCCSGISISSFSLGKEKLCSLAPPPCDTPPPDVVDGCP